MSVSVGRRGLRANRLVYGAVTGHDCRRASAASGAEKESAVAQKRATAPGKEAAGRWTRPRERERSRAPPPGALAIGPHERQASNDAPATGRARTPVWRAARRRVGDRSTRAAFRGLVVVRVIRCRSFGLCSGAFCRWVSAGFGCSSGGSSGRAFDGLPFARCDPLLVFALPVVSDRCGRERLRSLLRRIDFRQSKVFTSSRAVLVGLGPRFWGCDGMGRLSFRGSLRSCRRGPARFVNAWSVRVVRTLVGSRVALVAACLALARRLYSSATDGRSTWIIIQCVGDVECAVGVSQYAGGRFFRRVSPPNRSGRARPSGDAGPRAVVALSSSPRGLERPRKTTLSTSSSIPIETAASHRS
jgi:hypothetical protein